MYQSVPATKLKKISMRELVHRCFKYEERLLRRLTYCQQERWQPRANYQRQR